MPDGVQYGLFVYDVAPSEIVEIAVAAEEIGFHALWLGEHMLWPVGYNGHHPTQDAEKERTAPIIGASTLLPDPLVTLGAAAAATRTILLGTSVYLVTARHPLLSARAAASVANLAPGRFRFGLGAGWLREEFDALEVDFASRMTQFEEAVALLRSAWQGGTFEHLGEHWHVPEVQVVPERIDVPVILGGNSRRALNRAARLGDGWINSGLAHLDDVGLWRAQLEEELNDLGRDASAFEMWVRPTICTAPESERFASAGFRNQVFMIGELWPKGPDLATALKIEGLRSRAEEFGISKPRAGCPTTKGG